MNKAAKLGIEGERRQVTVLFSDVADYTTRSVSMDPEDLADDIRAFQTICGRVAEKYSGHITNFLGDGILVYFGYPHASEHDPARALRAGLEMVAAIELNNESPDWSNRVPILVRIGIATGLVVIGEKAGKRREQDLQAFGDAPNLASRLQSLANPNTILTANRTRLLVGGAFKFKDIGERELKGFPQTVNVWELVGENSLEYRNKIPFRSRISKFVSRDKELTTLNRIYRRASIEKTKVIHLVGGPGIGKSRLIRAFEINLKSKKDFRRIHLLCSPYDQNTAFKPVTDALQRRLRLSKNDNIRSKQQKLQWGITFFKITDEIDQLLFGELLNIQSPDHSKQLNISAEEKRLKLMELVTRTIIALSTTYKSVLIVEDLHWIDPSTMEMLLSVFKRTRRDSAFAIFSSRPEFSPPWEEDPSIIDLPLDRLNQTESISMIEDLFDDRRLPENLKQMIVTKSAGIPLHIEEYCWSLINRIDQSDEPELIEGNLEIPETLQDSFNARFDQSGLAKPLVQLAAVFGNGFSYSMIKRIAELNQIDVNQGMDSVLNSGLISMDNTRNDDWYIFRHTVIRDAAYQSLLKRKRIHFHRQIAELFTNEEPEIGDEQPELVAYHYSNTNDYQTAIEYWLKACKFSIEKSAVRESIEHLRQGLRLVSKVSDTKLSQICELRLKLYLGVSLTFTRGYVDSEIGEIYLSALKLSKQVGQPNQVLAALYGLWRYYIWKSNFKKSLRISVQLTTLLKRSDDDQMMAPVYGILAMTRIINGKFQSAEKYFNGCIKKFESDSDTALGVMFGQHPYVNTLALSSINLLLQNKISASQANIDKSIAAARQIGHPYSIAEALRLATIRAQLTRNTVEMRDYASDGKKLCQRYGFERLETTANTCIALADVIAGGSSEDIEKIEINIETYKTKNGMLLLPYHYSILAEANLILGEYQSCFDAANHGTEIVEEYGELWIYPELIRLKAESAAFGNLTSQKQVDEWVDTAIDISRRQNSDLFLNRCMIARMNFSDEVPDDDLYQTTIKLAWLKYLTQ